jgi:UPF0716 protein FxsA
MLLLALIFIVVPIIEIYLIIKVGQAIGPLWTVLVLVVDSIIGVRLLRWQGGRAWVSFQTAMAAGRVPHREIMDGVLIVLGGAFLLTPGFMTDVLGLALLIPPSRALVRRFVTRILQRRSAVRFARVVVRRKPERWDAPPPTATPTDSERGLPPG